MSKAISSASPSHVKLASGETCNVVIWRIDEEGDLLAGYIRDGALLWYFPENPYGSGSTYLVDGPAPQVAEQ